MTKSSLFFLTATFTIIILGTFFLSKKGNQSNTNVSPTSYEYFWSDTCPHCSNVAKFIETWEKKDTFKMEKIEINKSSENTQLFLERGTQICKISRNKLGVPLLVTPEGKCFFGDQPIIEFLKSI